MTSTRAGGGPLPPEAGRSPALPRKPTRPPGLLLLKVVLWLGCLAPAAWLGWAAFSGGLGVDPIETLTHRTGMAALVILLLTLAVSPLRRLVGWNPLIQIRRPLGLFAFFYAFLHFSVWMALDLGFQLSWVVEDIVERPFITVGFLAFLLLIPLAVTSTKGWIRKLGKRWTVLHRLVYVSAALGILHYYWRVRADAWLPVAMAVVLVILMAARIPGWKAARRRRQERGEPGVRRGTGSGKAAAPSD